MKVEIEKIYMYICVYIEREYTHISNIYIYIEYINVQMCIHSVQGFSLFKVVLLYDVTSGSYFCSNLREQLFIFFLKTNKKE